MRTEVIYLGHDNRIDLILKADSGGDGAFAAVDLTGVTRMTATFGNVTIESTNQAGDPIRWAQGGYITGEVRCDFGEEAISAGEYRVPLVVYDTANPDGIVWVRLPIQVVDEVEAS